MINLDKKENFRLTVKEERFLVRHLKVERPGFLQARVKDRIFEVLIKDQRGWDLPGVD